MYGPNLWSGSFGRLSLDEQSGEVKSAMFSYDGLRIITASMDGTARVKGSVALQRKPGTILCGMHDAVTWKALKLNHTGDLQACTEVWNVESGECLQVLQGHAKDRDLSGSG